MYIMNSPKTALMCLNDEIGKKLASLRSETVRKCDPVYELNDKNKFDII